jgi:hypothetical protein
MALGEVCRNSRAINFVQQSKLANQRHFDSAGRISMKRVLLVVFLVIGAATLGLWRSHSGVGAGLSKAVGMSNDDLQGEARDEIRKSFELQPGARLVIQDINGKVEIQTSDTKTAEVYVLRTAKNSESLTRREVVIEQTASGLVVRGKDARHAGFWEHLFGSHPDEQVTIKAPRQIALSMNGINGRVTSGDVDGTIEVQGINGHVELGQATVSAEIGGINGSVVVGLKQLGARGARISGVNGGIELKLANGLNADLTAKGMNGNVRSEISEVTVDREEFGHGYSAHIGSGGAPITLSGINGNVRLTRGDSALNTSERNEKKAVVVNQKASESAADEKRGRNSGQ